MPNKPRPRIIPSRFEIGETAVIRNLGGDDSVWNGSECIIASAAYEHPQYGKVVLNVIIDGDGTWALEPWNLKKIQNIYDGYKKCKWGEIQNVFIPKELKHHE